MCVHHGACIARLQNLFPTQIALIFPLALRQALHGVRLATDGVMGGGLAVRALRGTYEARNPRGGSPPPLLKALI
jgi:hypothetical protein